MTPSNREPINLKDFADIPLQTDDGKPVTLADYVGRRVLLFVFPKADTPGCTTQACGFRDSFPRITEAGAQVLGMSADSPAALARWKAKQKLPYTLLSDLEHRAIDRLGAWGERSMYGRKFQGILRSHFVFEANGMLLTAERKISPKDSIEKGVAVLVQKG